MCGYVESVGKSDEWCRQQRNPLFWEMSKEMLLFSLKLKFNHLWHIMFWFMVSSYEEEIERASFSVQLHCSTSYDWNQWWLRSGCAFAFPFSQESCVVPVVPQEEKSLRKDPREADGSTSTEAEHVIKVWPVHPHGLCWGQRQKEKEATSFGILEQINIWGKEQQKSWVNDLWTSI